MIKKLIEVQQKLKVPKGQYNAFSKYNYRSCEDIVEAVKPILAAQGLLLTMSDEIIEVGSRIYVKAIVTVTDGETEKTVTAFAREAESKKGMDESQITGAASSYARKYALNGMFAIDDTKDADAMQNNTEKASTQKSVTNYKEKTISEAQTKRFYAIAKGKDTAKISQMLKSKGYEKAADIRIKDYDTLITEIEKMSKK